MGLSFDNKDELPLLYKGFTRNFFNSFGKMPVDNDWLIRKVRGSIKTF